MIFNTLLSAALMFCWFVALVAAFNHMEHLRMGKKWISAILCACGVAASVYGVGKLLMLIWEI